MSVTPGSVLRVLNISLCKQRNSRLTQRSASCGIRNSIFDVDRAGRQVQEGKYAQVSRGSPLHLITGLFIFYRQIWANGGEEREVVVNLHMMAGDGDAQWLIGTVASTVAHVTTINWFHHNFYLSTIRSRVSLFTRKLQFADSALDNMTINIWKWLFFPSSLLIWHSLINSLFYFMLPPYTHGKIYN